MSGNGPRIASTTTTRRRSSDSAARTEAACPVRTVRGGDWFSTEASLRPAARAKASADARHDDIGFRVARTLRSLEDAAYPSKSPAPRRSGAGTILLR